MVIGPSATTRPAARTAIRLQTLCRLSRSWVTMKTVNPKVRCRVKIRSECISADRIEPGRRLIQKNNFGIQRECPGERHSLDHAPR